jgi:hypothetical protein
MTCANVTGSVTGNLNCDLTVAPYGWTGTGMFNLVTGQLLMNVTTPNGAASAASDTMGDLSLGYADGTGETVTDADNAPLVEATAADSGVPLDAGVKGDASLPISGTYAMTAQAYTTILRINNAGQILGTATPSGGPTGSVFAASPTASAVSLGTGTAMNMNNAGQIVGVGLDSSPLYWAQPNPSPATLDYTGFTSATPYWSTPTSAPVSLPLPSVLGAQPSGHDGRP